MENLQQAAETVASLMRLMTSSGGLRLRYRVVAGAGAADPDGMERRDIYVECKGPDTELLLEHDAELLRSLEHIAAKMLRLEPEDHDRVSFDADGFKAGRAQALREIAEEAMERVEDTDRPYRFAPMNSRERRMLHLFLKDSGLQTASSGEGPNRSVVLYPEGYKIPEEQVGDDRRSGFDRRRGYGRGPSRSRGQRSDRYQAR
jgi:spoIIIJ-associated protein